MSILKRGIVVFSLIIVFAILATFLISYFIIDRGFLEFERENTSRTLSQVQTAELIILLIVASIILICGLLTFLLIYKFILKRLKDLSSEVKNIGDEKNFARRLNSNGKDELSTLASSINSMIDELNDLQSSWKQSKERYRSLMRYY